MEYSCYRTSDTLNPGSDLTFYPLVALPSCQDYEPFLKTLKSRILKNEYIFNVPQASEGRCSTPANTSRQLICTIFLHGLSRRGVNYEHHHLLCDRIQISQDLLLYRIVPKLWKKSGWWEALSHRSWNSSLGQSCKVIRENQLECVSKWWLLSPWATVSSIQFTFVAYGEVAMRGWSHRFTEAHSNHILVRLSNYDSGDLDSTAQSAVKFMRWPWSALECTLSAPWNLLLQGQNGRRKEFVHCLGEMVG